MIFYVYEMSKNMVKTAVILSGACASYLSTTPWRRKLTTELTVRVLCQGSL